MNRKLIEAMSFNIYDIIDNSYKDFHTKGLDYICLYRSEDITIKIYLMEGVVSQLAEVVNPHDHRYIFDSCCLAGRMTNHKFSEIENKSDKGKLYETFDYMTPLNGGSGFTHTGQTRLIRENSIDYNQYQTYRMKPTELHTIQVYGEQTALLLYQYKDEIALDKPTKTYCLNSEPPSLSGLYSRFTKDQILQSIKKLERVARINIKIY